MRNLPLIIAITALLAACGGASQEDYIINKNTASTNLGSYTSPVASTRTFPIQSAFESITSNYVVANLSGSENSATDPSWLGQITISRRTSAVTTSLGQSTYAVDYDLRLHRNRDGVEFRDVFTVFFDAVARPLAMVALNSYISVWKTPIDGLPTYGRVGASGGTGLADICYSSLTASLTNLDCSAQFYTSANLTSWAFLPDTAETGLINFTFKPGFTVNTNTVTTNTATTNLVSDIGIRIDSTGTYRGIVYTRIEGDFVLKLSGT